MERGLLWLPLLVLFFWLAWSGWNEYQKIEAYRRWAEDFERSKYDIYAVLGQKGKLLTWGKPTRSGTLVKETFNLDEVQAIRLLVNNQPVDPVHLNSLPKKGKSELEFSLSEGKKPIKIPFTEILLAAQWAQFLNRLLSEGFECY
jgi:hypothetical protein